VSNIALSLIVAVAKNGVIGKDNKLLWRLKTDLKRFRSLTMGKPIIMGRKTFQSIGCLLPGRESIIITRDTTFKFEGAHVVHSLPEAVELGQTIAAQKNTNELMIIGGAEIYAQALPLCNKLYVTEVDLEPEGDAFFSPIEATQFDEIKRVSYPIGADDEAAFSFVDYTRC
jgi:dihydrofolate reductase